MGIAMAMAVPKLWPKFSNLYADPFAYNALKHTDNHSPTSRLQESCKEVRAEHACTRPMRDTAHNEPATL